jgi:hypothetical protein
MAAFEKVKPKIRFTEEETRKFDIEQKVLNPQQVQVQYNKEVGEEYYVDIKIPSNLMGYIVGRLKKMSEEKKITENFLTLYEKFVV